MENKNKMIIVITFLIILVLIFYFSYKGFKIYNELKSVVTVKQQEIEKLKDELKGYQQLLAENEKQLLLSEKNRQILAKKIAEKIAESKNIKEPKDINEIKNRLLQLGFNPIIIKR